MTKEEADRLRNIADVLYDHGYDIYMDRTSDEAKWFRFGAEEIRKVISDSGFSAFNDAQCSTTRTTIENFKKEMMIDTTTTHRFNKEESI